MKRFLYGRLHDRENGYGFYIQPSAPIGALLDHIISERLEVADTWLFLQNEGGRVIFGVREQLELTDELGRLRRNFTGFELEPHESSDCVPYLRALLEKLGAITTEAYDAHRVLDANPNRGDSLINCPISFDQGNFQSGNDWDEAVASLYTNPHQSFSMIFDHQGERKVLAARVSRLQARVAQNAARHGEGDSQDQHIKSPVRKGPVKTLPAYITPEPTENVPPTPQAIVEARPEPVSRIPAQTTQRDTAENFNTDLGDSFFAATNKKLNDGCKAFLRCLGFGKSAPDDRKPGHNQDPSP